MPQVVNVGAMRGTGGWAVVAATLGVLALSSEARAQVVGNSGADRWVTIAARECDSYQDIRGNLARNDIMESLQNLGADTFYQSGEPVDPRTELRG